MLVFIADCKSAYFLVLDLQIRTNGKLLAKRYLLVTKTNKGENFNYPASPKR